MSPKRKTRKLKVVDSLEALKDLGPIVVHVAGNKYKVNPYEEISLTGKDINRTMIEHPGRFLWWAAALEDARTRRDSIRSQHAITKATYFRSYRELYERNRKVKGDNYSLDDLHSEVQLHDKMIAIQESLDEAEAEVRLLEHIREAWLARRALLNSIGANMRDDRQGGRPVRTLKK